MCHPNDGHANTQTEDTYSKCRHTGWCVATVIFLIPSQIAIIN